MRLNPSTEIISKAFIITDAEIVWYNHSTFTLYHLLFFIITIIIIIITIWKGYFGVNPILSSCSFESRKSVVVDVVIAAKACLSSKPNLFI